MTTYAMAVARLQPIVPVLFDSLQAGLSASVEEHERQRFRRELDPQYFSHTARRHASDRLRDHGLLVADVDDGRGPQMSSLQVAHDGLHLWILRSDDGVPLPVSQHKQRFYRQEPSLDGGDNLLLLWSDVEGELLDPMQLVRPLGGDERRHTLRLDWSGPLHRWMHEMSERDLAELEPAQLYETLDDPPAARTLLAPADGDRAGG